MVVGRLAPHTILAPNTSLLCYLGHSGELGDTVHDGTDGQSAVCVASYCVRPAGRERCARK